MIRSKNVKSIMAVLFITLLFMEFVLGGAYLQIPSIAEYLSTKGSAESNAAALSAIETDFSAGLWKHRALIELNGAVAKLLKIQGYYSDIGLYVTEDAYIVSAEPYTSTDYEYEQTVSLKHFLDDNGIKLLYVNEPTKYDDDSLFAQSFGVETYTNRNTDLFLSRIREAGVPVLDLRDCAHAEGLKISDLFYRTDHHWTVGAGLWATQRIAGAMNEFCGYDIDTTLYDLSNYKITEWRNCWLGEQGKKVAQFYVGLDDYTEIEPDFTTDFTFKRGDGTSYDGSFENFINQAVYNPENDVYSNMSWHYAYSQLNCVNNRVEHGKVLLLGDSYDQVTEPFLALGVHEVDALILRNYSDFDLRGYILANGYDTVLICYAQFMIGAHDNPDSANYRMFAFD